MKRVLHAQVDDETDAKGFEHAVKTGGLATFEEVLVVVSTSDTTAVKTITDTLAMGVLKPGRYWSHALTGRVLTARGEETEPPFEWFGRLPVKLEIALKKKRFWAAFLGSVVVHSMTVTDELEGKVQVHKCETACGLTLHTAGKLNVYNPQLPPCSRCLERVRFV